MSAELVIEVPFYDLDPMEVVWHGNYVKYFERVRCALLAKFDYGYPEMKESGYMWPIVDMRLKYVNSASFGQKLRCKATIVEFENRLKIKYQILCDETGKRLTRGYTTQVAVDINTREMLLVSPEILLKKLGVQNENC
nr:acyl-CoA thioesterase [Aliikangiella coralliicola]